MTPSASGLARESRPLVGGTVPAVAAMLLLSAPAFGAAQSERAIVELVLNDVPRGEVLVVLEDGEIWLPVDALDATGVELPAGRRTRFDDRTYVSAASLEPDITTTFDERTLAVRLVAVPALLPRTSLTVTAERPLDIEYTRTPGGFVNYAAAWRPGSGTDVFAEGGLTVGPLLLEVQASRLADDRRVVRGLTTLVVDQRRAMRRWSFGDVVSPGGALQSAFVVGGLSLAREYSLDPYYVRHPSPAFSGMIATPSTVDVYVNGVFVRRETLAPGPFEVRQLPLTTGLGTTQMTVRDAYGRVTEMGSPYYLPSGILKRGSVEYRYTVGARRSTDTTRQAEYGALVAAGSSRAGVTDWLTLGGEFEADRQGLSGGATASLRLWRLGEIEWASAASRRDGQTGHAGTASYAFVTRAVTLSATARMRSGAYTTLTMPPAGQTLTELAGSISLPLGARVSMSLQHAASDLADTTGGGYVRRTVTSLTTNWRLGPYADLHATTSWAGWQREPRGFTASTGLTILLGTQASVGVSHDRPAGETPLTVIDAQRSIPAGTGFGYLLRGERGATRLGHASVEYQNGVGRWEVTRDVSAGSPGTSVTAAGAVVAAGRRLHVARAITGGYALVQVPGAPNVRVYANNQEVGRTDRRGNAIVPNLLPYYGNRLNIAPEDVPLDRTLERVWAVIAPPFHGAALARFSSLQRRAVWGVLAIGGDAGTTTAPAYGELRITVAGAERLSPVGAGGEFYFEDLPAAVYSGRIDHGGRTYICAFRVPELAGLAVDLGRVECRPDVTGERP